MVGPGILILILIILDQATKYLAKFFLEGKPPFVFINNVITLSYQTNDGASFGILSGQLWLFILLTLAALVIFFYLFRHVSFKTKKVYSIGISLMIAGTIGNLLDRIFHKGLVIDFLLVELYEPILKLFGLSNFYNNFADMYLFVGIFLFAIDMFFLEKKRESFAKKEVEVIVNEDIHD